MYRNLWRTGFTGLYHTWWYLLNAHMLNEECITYFEIQCVWKSVFYDPYFSCIMILVFYCWINVIHRLKWTLFLLDRCVSIYYTRVPKWNIITLCFTSTELCQSQYTMPELFGETEVNDRINNTMEKPKNCRYFASCPLPPFTLFCHCWRDALRCLYSVHDEGNVVGCPTDKENQHKDRNDSCPLALLLLLALWVVT